MSRPVTKWNHQARVADDIPDVVRRALDIAKSGRPGPVLIDVPKDVQLTPLGHGSSKPSSTPTRRRDTALLPRTSAPCNALPTTGSVDLHAGRSSTAAADSSTAGPLHRRAQAFTRSSCAALMRHATC